MQASIEHLKRFKRGKRGISTVIVVMLSLVLVVIIVGNVVLWSYQMNQVDWEKMQEKIDVVGAQTVLQNSTQYPSAYTLMGGTTLTNGGLSNLTADDGTCMTFRSYNSAIGTSDFVDNNSSNVDSSDAIGTHSNFTAMQYGPDSINDILTEADARGYTLNDWVDSNTSNVDGHTGHGTSSNFTAQRYTDTINDTLTEAATSGWNEAWVSPTNFQDPTSVWSTETNAYDESISTSASCSVAPSSWSGYLVLNLTAPTTGSKLEYYVGRSGSQIDSMTIDVANATGSWVNIYAGVPFVDAWTNVTGVTHTITAMRFRFYNSHSSQARTAYVYEADYLNNSVPFNYELDYEFQWTSANYTSDNEQLCIRTGPLGSETLGVYVWNGASWTNIIASLAANSWNNVSVATYLTTGTITFRYLGVTESGDTVQSTWQIESALLYTWNNSNYRLDVEAQFQNVDNTTVSSNQELCIFAGTWSTSETIKVDVWNTTSNSWVNVIASLTKNAWNNVSIANLLTATVTIRFTDGNQSSDTIQDSWSIDAALLHAWYGEYSTEVEFTSVSNIESWTQLNWTTNVGWTVGSVSVTVQLYNFTSGAYQTSGFGYSAYTSSSTPNTDENSSQSTSVRTTDFRNATGGWKIKIKGVKTGATQFDLKADFIEFHEVKQGGALLTLENGGSLTSHVVSIWIDNSTIHQRFPVDVFINSGETLSQVYPNVNLPIGTYTVKVATERGNMAILPVS